MCVFVGNLPYDVAHDELTNLFKDCGIYLCFSPREMHKAHLTHTRLTAHTHTHKHTQSTKQRAVSHVWVCGSTCAYTHTHARAHDSPGTVLSVRLPVKDEKKARKGGVANKETAEQLGFGFVFFPEGKVNMK